MAIHSLDSSPKQTFVHLGVDNIIALAIPLNPQAQGETMLNIDEVPERTRIANQRLVNAAHKHLHTTGVPSVDITGACRYGGDEYTGCAFSPCIQSYDCDLEGRPASELLGEFPDELHNWVLPANGAFANSVQRCHDDSVGMPNFLEEFDTKLRSVCSKWGCTFPGDQQEGVQ